MLARMIGDGHDDLGLGFEKYWSSADTILGSVVTGVGLLADGSTL